MLLSGIVASGLLALNMGVGELNASIVLPASLMCLGMLAKWGSRGVADFALRGLILTVPISFRSILGGPYEELPISWFNVFEILLVLITFFRPVPSIPAPKIWPPVIFYFVFAFLPAFVFAYDLPSALKQYLHLMAFAALVFSAEQLKDLFGSSGSWAYARLYVLSVEVTAFALFSQIAAARLWGISVGTQIVMGGQREAFGGSFNDFSYLSIFLATGAALNYAAACSATRKRLWLLSRTLLLLTASILTTARSGFAAFVIGLVVWHGVDVFTARRPRRAAILAFAAAAIASIGLWSVMGSLRENVLDDSGRHEGYRVAMRALQDKVWFGVGLGVSAYREYVGEAIPHNSAIQYLVQGGVIGFSGVLLLGLAITLRAVRGPAPILAGYLVALMGSQFVPDLVNSRFFPVLCVLALGAAEWPRSAVRGRIGPIPNARAA